MIFQGFGDTTNEADQGVLAVVRLINARWRLAKIRDFVWYQWRHTSFLCCQWQRPFIQGAG
jgi:hypothetical protein